MTERITVGEFIQMVSPTMEGNNLSEDECDMPENLLDKLTRTKPYERATEKPPERGKVYDISIKQHNGKNPWVGALINEYTRPDGAPIEGRYLHDEGDYFAIRYPVGVVVFRRVAQAVKTGWMDRGEVAIIIYK
jgi:hypothetical protein